MASTRKSSSKSNDTALETSESIAAQTAKFIASGGKIQEIPTGVSGQVATSGPRHITLGRRKTG
ncbi:MAG: hypothetical protein WD601_00745 [Pseudohongiellaceae bacterium]